MKSLTKNMTNLLYEYMDDYAEADEESKPDSAYRLYIALDVVLSIAEVTENENGNI